MALGVVTEATSTVVSCPLPRPKPLHHAFSSDAEARQVTGARRNLHVTKFAGERASGRRVAAAADSRSATRHVANTTHRIDERPFLTRL